MKHNRNTIMKWRLLLFCASILLSAPVKSQSFFISSRNSQAVKLYDAAGNYINDIVTPGSGGLSYPQEVLYHPSDFLLVTGRGNSYIKKYDISTGAYLGNFTSGYLLDNPTKTSIWNDSLIYVSQWGSTQNKVARFDLTTGVFVDEFTSTGISNGGGHAWDTLGNLYVAQYGSGADGQVLKFDPAGAYLGVFIPTGVILGPINLWFDNANALCVEDWTHGKVFKFDGTTGAYISTMVSGITNAEGFAFDSTGNLYLCDWTSNIIYKYDTSSTLSTFITTGNLMAPNSILIRPGSVSSVNESPSGIEPQVSIFPTPFKSEVSIKLTLSDRSDCSLSIFNGSGQLIKTICSNTSFDPGEHICKWNGKSESGTDVKDGTYLLEVRSENRSQVFKLLKNQSRD